MVAQTDEDGWSSCQALAHIASTAGNAKFILAMARAGGGDAPQPADWGNPRWNEEQVEARADSSASELLEEIRADLDEDIAEVNAAPDDLLAMHFVAPWGPQGAVSDVIIASADRHLGGHVAELRARSVARSRRPHRSPKSPQIVRT